MLQVGWVALSAMIGRCPGIRSALRRVYTACESAAGGRGLVSDPALESELVRRVARGDEVALAVLYDRLAPLAYGLALRIAGDKRSAQDAVQEAFLNVWHGAERFVATRGTARAWVLRIVRNSAIDRARSEGAHERARLRAIELGGVSWPAAPERPDLQLVGQESRSALDSALDELPAEQRRLIEIAFFQGLSHTEIATREGIPLGTVKARIRTGIGRLRQIAAQGRIHA